MFILKKTMYYICNFEEEIKLLVALVDSVVLDWKKKSIFYTGDTAKKDKEAEFMKQ